LVQRRQLLHLRRAIRAICRYGPRQLPQARGKLHPIPALPAARNTRTSALAAYRALQLLRPGGLRAADACQIAIRDSHNVWQHSLVILSAGCKPRFTLFAPFLVKFFRRPPILLVSAIDPRPPFSPIDQALEAPCVPNLPQLARHAAAEDWRRFLIGDSQPMRDVCHIIRLVGARRATVLITGETGSGKEMAARALHLAGPRGRGPFVAVNCTALPDNLLEDALFGHVRGAFTGAMQSRVGRFEQAHGGVLFLDEIGELPLELQPKLLRVLQEREFQRLGSSETIKVDVRIVAAANCDLLARIALGRFREDLYYRLNVAPIHMPPLRQRTEDIPALAAHFVEKVCRAEELPPKRIVPEAMDRLRQCPWPGNVRQLENAVEMAVALSGDRLLLTPADFPQPAPAPSRMAAFPGPPSVSVPDCGLDYESTVTEIERSILGQALRKTGGNKKAAAAMLRLKRTTLSAKVRSLESIAYN